MRIGDRLAPAWLEVDFPGAGDQPSFAGRVEIQKGVPRWTEIVIRQRPGGREVRERDLRAVSLDAWLDAFVAAASSKITSDDGTELVAEMSADPTVRREAMRVVQDARKGSRRPVTDTRLRQVAEVYNAQETRGLDAIMAAFGISKSTAQRDLRRARAAGYVTKGDADRG